MWPTLITLWLALSGQAPPRPAPRRRPPFRRPASRPRLEALEDRCLLSAGALDPTFGSGAGYVTTSLSNSTDSAYSVLVQPDGKIVVTGSVVQSGSSTSAEAGMVRYNADGSLDTSFGSGGVVLGPTTMPTWYFPEAALYPTTGTANDGKILLASFSTK